MAGAAGVTVAGPSIVLAHPAPLKVDIAVVGGGMAGLYAALRLKRETQGSVALFEATDRIGGRVLSVTFPGMTRYHAEIGAMRLRNTDAIAVKLTDTLLGAEARRPFVYPTNGWYVRDRRLRDLSDPATLPYAFDAAESAILGSGANLTVETIEVLDALRNTTPEAVKNQGLWELLLRSRSKDGVNFIKDTTGYHSVFSNWEAATAIDWFLSDFAPGTTFWSVLGGMERLPAAMGRVFAETGGQVHTDHRLTAIHPAPEGALELIFDGPDGAQAVVADRVVLAVPPKGLDGLSATSLVFRDPRFREALRSVRPEALAKIHFAFQGAWWDGTFAEAGRVVTDLPIRQSYTWGWDPGSGHGLMMASYHDGPQIAFWDYLADGPGYNPPGWADAATGVDGRPLAPSVKATVPASTWLVEEAWRQTKVIYGLVEDAPPPLSATYLNWGESSFGSGYHLWSVGADPAATIAFLQEPIPGLHMCGEAWSYSQGWIAGALDTAEAMLQAKFNLPPYV